MDKKIKFYKIGNTVEILNKRTVGEHDKGYNATGEKSPYERTKDLRQYTLEHDLPFILFGD